MGGAERAPSAHAPPPRAGVPFSVRVRRRGACAGSGVGGGAARCSVGYCGPGRLVRRRARGLGRGRGRRRTGPREPGRENRAGGGRTAQHPLLTRSPPPLCLLQHRRSGRRRDGLQQRHRRDPGHQRLAQRQLGADADPLRFPGQDRGAAPLPPRVSAGPARPRRLPLRPSLPPRPARPPRAPGPGIPPGRLRLRARRVRVRSAALLGHGMAGINAGRGGTRAAPVRVTFVSGSCLSRVVPAEPLLSASPPRDQTS